MMGKDLSVRCWYMEVMYNLNRVLKTKFEVCDNIHVLYKTKKKQKIKDPTQAKKKNKKP